MFAWIRKGYGNPDGLSFWLGLYFLHPAQFLAELVHLTRETSCVPAPPAQMCGSSCNHPPSIELLVIFSHRPFNNLNVSLMLACLGTPDLITVLFFYRCPGKLFTMKMQMQYLPYRQ